MLAKTGRGGVQSVKADRHAFLASTKTKPSFESDLVPGSWIKLLVAFLDLILSRHPSQSEFDEA